jgi:lipopolysaccharide biosynthesis glycosyltransferase
VDELFTVTKQYQGMISGDQDVFNIVFKGKYKELEKRYNITNDCIFRKNDNSNTLIRHFSGNIKPWKTKRIANFFDHWKYTKFTAYYDEFEYDELKNDNTNYISKTISVNFLKFIPFLKIVDKNNIMTIKLFGILPLFKIKY